MRRRLFTAASVLSLLLCGGILCARAIVWWTQRPVIWTITGGIRADGTRPIYEMGCDAFGRVGGGSVRELPRSTALVSVSWARSRPIFLWRHWGFTIMWGENISAIDYSGDPNRAKRRYAKVLYDSQTRYVSAPVWAVAGPLLLLPLFWVRSRRRERRARRRIGCCPRCEYNLTGNLSGVCPECGRALAKGA